MEGAIRVLHVDDDPYFRQLTVDCLEREGPFSVDTAATAAAGCEPLEEADCVISDYDMPEADGIEFLESVREDHPDLPFILFTGQGSERIASEAMSAGVTDYLQKSGGTEQFTLLANRIENAVEAARSKRQLAERTRRLETLIDNLPGMVYRCYNEPEWPMENVEGEAEELTGYTARELESGECVWGEEVIHPDDRERLWESVQDAVDDQETFEVNYRILTRDGEIRWMWERGDTVESGDEVVLEGFITDVTDRREREQELEQYEKLIDTVEDSIFLVDEHGNIEKANASAVGAMGMDDAKIEGDNAVSLAAKFATSEEGADNIQAALEEAIERGCDADPVRTEIGFDLPTGTETVEYQLTPFTAGSERKIAVIGRNVTRRKEREQELRRKNERLERFASIVSHDLRNPLQIASTRIELAGMECNSDHLADAEDALGRMEQLIGDILTLAREGEHVSETEAVDLDRVTRESWNQVRSSTATLKIETERTIEADRDRLKQVLTNLLENAVEHSCPESAEAAERPTESTNGGDGATIRVGEMADGFYVADDGPGIPQEDREKVFDEGYTTATDGTGFGLSIVEEIAAAHGWEIGVTDSECGGARFEIAGVETAEE